jgi:iron complex outermembrane receptor protein
MSDKTSRYIASSVALFVMLCLSSSPALGISLDELREEEELLLLGEDFIYIAARHKQKKSEAPSSVYVITAEDIRQSGAINIPDILRMVPGLEVMQVAASDIEVGARGFNNLLSNKMLVMIDGRSVYLDFYGMVLWESLPIVLEEIDRIEVIRGPGSALYGANAFSGVINIITKSPEKLKDFTLSATGGDYRTRDGSLIVAGVKDKFGYKATLGGKALAEWMDSDEDALGVVKGNALLEYNLGNQSSINLSGGISDGGIDILVPGTNILYEYDGRHYYLRLGYERPDFSLRFYQNDDKWRIIPDDTAETDYTTVRTGTYDIEFQQSFDFKLGVENLVTWGGSWRENEISWELIHHERQHTLWAGFLQDELRLGDGLLLTLGGRYDDHPMVGGHFAPRASLVYTPVANHTIRFSAAKAYRNPTFLESHMHVEKEYAFPGLSGPDHLHFHGNTELEPEEVISYEFGYQTKLFEKVELQLDLFHNFLKNFIDAEVIEYGDVILPSPPTPPWVPPIPPQKLFEVPIETGFVNIGKARAWGGEAGLNVPLCDWFAVFANYAYQRIIDDETGERIKSAPRHKFNGGLRLKLDNGISGSLLLHYVDKTEWAVSNEEGDDPEKIKGYTLLNTRLGYRFLGNRMEVAVMVFNLLHDKHREHPLGDELGTRFTTTLSYAF